MRAHVPDPQGAASTWPGPHTSAFGDTPAASGSSWMRTLSTLVLPRPGTSTRSWAFTASRTAIPRCAIFFTCSRRTATPTCGRLDDGEDVADADRDVDRHLAHRPRPRRAGRPATTNDGVQRSVTSRTRSPSERAIVSTAPASVSMTIRVSAPVPRDHPGLDGHRRRPDGALAARDVVPAGIDEEEPECRARRDRLGHHRDQQAAMAARLQAEAGPEMVQVLLEPAPLVPDRGARQMARGRW